MGALWAKLLSVFHSKHLELAIVGISGAGKTTLLDVMSSGYATETAPTVGLNLKMVRAGNVNMKCWDIGGQHAYRAEWARYARGCDAILFVVDAYARELIPESRAELHRLLEDRSLAGIPICVVANKIDLHPHMVEDEIIRELNLDYIMDNPWVISPVSAKFQTHIDHVLDFLIKQAK